MPVVMWKLIETHFGRPRSPASRKYGYIDAKTADIFVRAQIKTTDEKRILRLAKLHKIGNHEYCEYPDNVGFI